ncbi:hypothetical protein [Chitinophaga vietnamensis]|uniref:hypothetical protein n=1 Tax=Chitinophaga vietnamensis TaxID=2593957 RepID=UPI0011778144|nr:hypothetical protein [Chitinophaga vietnamensis]
MKKFLILILLTGLFYACKKDNYGSKPILTFKGYSTSALTTATTNLDIILNVKDGDGDIEDTIAWERHYYIPPATVPVFQVWKMPNIGQHEGHSVDAEVSLHLGTSDFRGWVEGTGTRPDSIWFRVFIVDKAGHHSDTIITPKLPIIKQ